MATIEEDWGVARAYADGSLPAPGVYGIPDVWPHVAAALERVGFAPGDRVEAVLVADVWELHVDEDLRRRGIGTWLVGHGADWLRLARADRLLDYVILGEGDAHLASATALGFRELTRTRRGWERP